MKIAGNFAGQITWTSLELPPRFTIVAGPLPLLPALQGVLATLGRVRLGAPQPGFGATEAMMPEQPRMTVTGVVLGAPDAQELAGFYHRLLGWQFVADEPGWAKLESPDGGPGLSFQDESGYVRPAWPAGPGDQQMMVHLDIRVDDLDEAGAHAIAAGADLATFQPQDDVRVYLDPDGHPFCLWIISPD